MKTKFFRSLAVASILAQVAVSLSAHADESYSSYDSIINELSTSSRTEAPSQAKSEFDSIRFHAGVGLITSRLSLDLPGSLPSSQTLRGVEARLGIDLFSPNWVAEGAVRSYTPEEFSGGELEAKEFDLLLTHHFRPGRSLDFTLGGGMAARYIEVSGPVQGEFSRSNSTPMSTFSVGAVANITSAFNIGGDISIRNALVSDTIDSSSLDLSLRVAGRF